MFDLLNSKLIDKLWFVAEEHGLRLRSFNIDFGEYSVSYLDTRIAWKMLDDQIEISDDEIDKILRKATITSATYHNFAEMVNGEIDTLMGRKHK